MSSEAKNAAPSPGPRLDWAEWMVPVVVFAFCGIVSYMTTTFDKAPDIIVGDAMQPRNFPLFLMAVTAVLNCVLILQMVRAGNKPRPHQPPQTLITAILVAMFWPGAVYVDMFLTFTVIMFLMCLVWGERRIWVAALVAVLVPLTIFFTFDQVLEVRFPRGLLTNIYYG